MSVQHKQCSPPVSLQGQYECTCMLLTCLSPLQLPCSDMVYDVVPTDTKLHPIQVYIVPKMLVRVRALN